MMRRQIKMLVVSAAMACLPLMSVRAEDYPNRPVRVVVPFAAGGAVDVVARVMAQHLSEKLGQNFYVENRPGASGNVGANAILQAGADGYSLLISASTFVVNPIVAMEKPNFDPLKDFTQIALIAKGPLLFIVHPEAAMSVKDFVDRAKANPNKYNLSTGGYGSAGHMSAESFKIKAGLNIPVVLYRGTGPVLNDLVGGHVSGLLDPLVTSLPLAQSGKVKALAISGTQRSPLAPDVPTFAEAGFGNFEFYTWYGLWAPAGLPADVLAKIEATVQDVRKVPDTLKWFGAQGLEFSGATGTVFQDFERDEQAKYEEIMKVGNIAKQ